MITWFIFEAFMGWAPKSSSAQIRLIHVEITRRVVNFPTMSDMDAVQNQMLFAVLMVLFFIWFIKCQLIFSCFWQFINYKNNFFLYFSYFFILLFLGWHCCPQNFICDVDHGVCRSIQPARSSSNQYSNLIQFILSKLRNILT